MTTVLDDEQTKMINTILSKYKPQKFEDVLVGGLAGGVTYNVLRKRPTTFFPPAVAAIVTGVVASNMTQLIITNNNLRAAVEDGSLDATFPDCAAKDLILEKVRRASVSNEKWQQIVNKNENPMAQFAQAPTDNSRSYTSYGQLAQQNANSHNTPNAETNDTENHAYQDSPNENYIQGHQESRLGVNQIDELAEKMSDKPAVHRYSDLYNANAHDRQRRGDKIAENSSQNEFIKRKTYINKFGDEVDLE